MPKINEKNQRRAYIYALLSVLLWSTSASAFKITLRYITFNSLFFLSILASLFAIIIVLIFSKKISQITAVTKKEIFLFSLLGFLNPFLYYLILFKAYSLIPAQLAQPLNFIWPIMIVLISIPLLKQKITFKNIIAIFISFLGVVIISTKGRFNSIQLENPLGIGLALFSSIIWAFFWVLSIKNKSDALIKLFYLFLFGSVYVTVFYIFFAPKEEILLNGLLGSAYIGFFEMGFTFVIWYYALFYSQTTAKVNNLIYLTPFLSLIFISIIVGEKILLSTVIGLIFILIGILLQNLKHFQER